jgi:hypothetical protein
VRRDVPWLLWMLRNLDTSRVAVEELGQAYEILLANVRGVASHLGVRVTELLPPVGDAERAQAAEESARAAEALAGGQVEEATRAWVRAVAADPWDGAARVELAAALAAFARVPKIDARSFRILAFAEELLAAPEMLAAYGGAFGEGDDVTLVIQAPPEGVEDVAHGLAQAAGAATADLLVHPCDDPAELLATGLGAVYTRRPSSSPFDAVPHVADPGAVRALAAR